MPQQSAPSSSPSLGQGSNHSGSLRSSRPPTGGTLSTVKEDPRPFSQSRPSFHRRKPPPSRLKTPIEQRHVPIVPRHSEPIKSAGKKHPGLTRSPSSVPLVPRTERNHTAWISDAVPKKSPLAGGGSLRESLGNDPFFRPYYNTRIDKEEHQRKGQDAGAPSWEQKKTMPWWPWVYPDRGREAVELAQNGQVSFWEWLSQIEFPCQILDAVLHLSLKSQLGQGDLKSSVALNIRIVGASSVEQSSFISQALELSSLSSRSPKSADVVVAGKLVTLRFSEQPLDVLEAFNPETDDTQSMTADQTFFNEIDGAITVYDAQDSKSKEAVLAALTTLQEEGIPNLLVASQTDSPDSSLKERVKLLVGGFEIFSTSVVSPESAKRCFLILIQHIIYERSESIGSYPQSQRSRSRTSNDCSSRPTRSQPHSRATSDVVPSFMKTSASTGDIYYAMSRVSTSSSGYKQASEIGSEVHLDESNVNDTLEKSVSSEQRPETGRSADSSGSRPFGSIPSVSSTLQLSVQGGSTSRSSSISRRTNKAPVPMPEDQKPDQKTLEFQELVDRLIRVYKPQSKDGNFISMFLELYRMFSAPVELLEELTSRIVPSNDVSEKGKVLSSEEHILSIIEFWINSHSGDFAGQSTQSRLARLISSVEKGSRNVALVEKLRFAMTNAMEDDDTRWPRSDKDVEEARTSDDMKSLSSVSTEPKPEAYATTLGDLSISNSFTEGFDAESLFRNHSLRTLSAMGPSNPATDSVNTLMPTPNAVGSAQRQAIHLSPSPSLRFSKNHWRQLMDQPEESIAKELTRIDWIMFSAIRPRDLVRHATLRPEEHRHYKGLTNVDRMIEHFNHLVQFVTNVVIFREKPKHRSIALEKFMRVARRLRELNNYNSLGAIVAAVQGSTIHRLAATRELVPVEVEKDFMKLEILMSTQKGHLPYRLAWDNTSGPRIPFFFLHRRDLVIAAVANKTFLESEPRPLQFNHEGKAPSFTSSHPQETDEENNEGDAKGKGYSGSPATEEDDFHTPPTVTRSTFFDDSNGSETDTESIRQSEERKSREAPAKQHMQRAEYCPVKLQQLADARDSGNQLEGERKINWTKFEIIGDVLQGIQRAQTTPYTVKSGSKIAGINTPNDVVKSLLLKSSIVKDEDELYERSCALEPSAGAGANSSNTSKDNGDSGGGLMSPVGTVVGGGMRRKLTWLAKNRSGDR